LDGVPVKDYVIQSGEFMLCTFALAYLAAVLWQQHRRPLAIALALLALGFFANIIFIATARATLVAAVVLVMAFALARFGWRGTLAIALGVIAVAALAWVSSPYLRQRVLGIEDEIEVYRTQHVGTSTGYRIEFWTKSLKYIATAPIFGHGTGTIREQFREDEAGEGLAGAPDNPHNQTLSIALQLGLIGVGVLYAMWFAHLLLFRAGGLAGWMGAAVVIQNVVMSLFNSQIFYFAPGWLYVFGVGVLGGVVLRERGWTAPPL
jgi:O-antigen ligase